MFSRRFRGGVHPPAFKDLTSGKPTARASIPKRVVIPVQQHTGAPSKPLVKVGDLVKAGDQIGKADAFVSSPIHASISGKVTRVANHPNPVYGNSLSITIERDEGAPDGSVFKSRQKEEVDSLSKEALLDIIRDAGIVGLGGAGFPTHVKLSPPKEKKIDAVILNGAECEPYLTCDLRLMLEKAPEVLKGFEIIAGILGAADSYIAIEDNKPACVETMRKALRTTNDERRTKGIPSEVKERTTNDERRTTKISVLPTKYPQGAEKQLIKGVLDRDVPAGGLPMDVGCVVQNVGTAFAIYEAVYLGKPLIERPVTITGGCVKSPGNLWVRIGTPLKDLIEECGGFVKEPAKVIFGGPMMGITQYTLDVPIIKGTSGIVFLSEEEAREGIKEEGVCIRCARCVDSCPMLLVPTALMNLVKLERFAEAEERGMGNCIECGACAYECPSKIPLVDYLKFGKSRMKR